MLLIHPLKGQFRPTRFGYALGAATVLLPALCVLYARSFSSLAHSDLVPGTLVLLLTALALGLQLTALNLLYSNCPQRLFARRRLVSYVLLATTLLTFTFGFSSLLFLCLR
jgi:uncharacterized BrkB/YihY/UPF0761 family membrane protein